MNYVKEQNKNSWVEKYHKWKLCECSIADESIQKKESVNFKMGLLELLMLR